MFSGKGISMVRSITQRIWCMCRGMRWGWLGWCRGVESKISWTKVNGSDILLME